MQTREAEELRNIAVVSDESVFPDAPWLRGTWLLAPDPDQAVPTSARQLYFTLFSLTCQDFVVFCGVFFSEFLKNLGRGAATGKREGL